jgi:hypothetical protein
VPTYRPYVPQVVTIPDGSDVSPIIQFADKAALALEVATGNTATFTIQARSILDKTEWLDVITGLEASGNLIFLDPEETVKLYPVGVIRLKIGSNASADMPIGIHMKS